MSRILHGAAIVLAAPLSGTALAEQHSLPFAILAGSDKSVTRADLRQMIAQPAPAEKT